MKSKTEQTPLTFADLTARNTEALRRIADLKAERAAAMLDGKAFDAADLRAAQDEAGAVADALAEFSRREAARTAEEAAALARMTEAEKLEKVRALITQLAGDRSAAIADMESHTRAMMDAYKRAEQARGKLQATLYAHVRVTPVDLMANAQESRLSAAMTLELDWAELKSFQIPDMARFLSVGGKDAQRRQTGKAIAGPGSGHRVWRDAISH